MGNFTSAAVSGFASGAVTSGSFEGGLQGAFTAGMFSGAGDLIGATGAFAGGEAITDKFAQAAVHGVVGCVTSQVGGGKCGAGAMSAAFSKFATVNGFVGEGAVAGTITSAVIGGTASALGGGSFANGATTAAFGYLFNYCAHNGCWVTDEERQLFAAGKVREGYALSCKNGDGYACSALRVVNEAGAMETLTNMRLETSLINNGIVRSRYEAIPIMEAIKVDLGKAYVDYLDSLGASASNPQWPTRDGIGNFHDQVFQNYGAGKVFGGRISDSLIPRGWFDWCSTCKK